MTTPLDRFQELLRIPTISRTNVSETDWQPFEAFRGALPRLYPALHEKLELEVVAGHSLGGAVLELVMEHRMEQGMGLTAEPLHQGKAGRLMRAARALTLAGAAGSLLAGRSRAVAVLSGGALLAGSACTRFGVFEAGQASARDPKYTVVPQRERLAREGAVSAGRSGPAPSP